MYTALTLQGHCWETLSHTSLKLPFPLQLHGEQPEVEKFL